LNRYIDHGESENSTSGPTGSDLKVISRSNIDIILKIQHFERQIERAGQMTFKVTSRSRVEPWPTFLNFALHIQDARKQ